MRKRRRGMTRRTPGCGRGKTATSSTTRSASTSSSGAATTRRCSNSPRSRWKATRPQHGASSAAGRRTVRAFRRVPSDRLSARRRPDRGASQHRRRRCRGAGQAVRSKLPRVDATAAAADVQQLKSGKLRPSVFDLNEFATATINRRTGTTGSTGRVALVAGSGGIEAAISSDGTKVVTADCATAHSSDGGTER